MGRARHSTSSKPHLQSSIHCLYKSSFLLGHRLNTRKVLLDLKPFSVFFRTMKGRRIRHSSEAWLDVQKSRLGDNSSCRAAAPHGVGCHYRGFGRHPLAITYSVSAQAASKRRPRRPPVRPLRTGVCMPAVPNSLSSIRWRRGTKGEEEQSGYV